MTYQLKGFLRVEALINNNVGANSPIGEPSTLSMTYTRERGEYYDAAYPSYGLIGISSVDSLQGKVPVDINYANHVLEVAAFSVDYATGKGATIIDTDFRDDLLVHFGEKMINLNYGELISSGPVSLPSYLSWTNPLLPDNILKFWFADDAFRQQYDQFEIIVIAPFTNLDDFFLGPNNVKTKIGEIAYADFIDSVQLAKNGDPETAIRVNTYDYKNAAYPAFVFPTNWAVLVYGLAGDNIDAIKDATIAYVLAHSTHTRDEWTAILPDLFRRTEFVLIPRWDHYAIPNMTVQAGIYSPITNLKEGFAFAKAKVPEYTEVHISNSLDVFGVPFRSLSVLSIGNPQNVPEKDSVANLFSDYINSGTSSLDFNRMSLITQGWANIVNEMLIVAEKMTEFSDIPISMRRVKRNNNVYVARVYMNIQYLVLAKISIGV